MSFRKELGTLINSYNMEDGSNTPDCVLADFLEDVLIAFDKAVVSREEDRNKKEWKTTDIEPGEEE